MADGMMGDIGKLVSEANGLVAPGLGEALSPVLHSIQDATRELGDGMQGQIHTLVEGLLDIEPHVEMIDETTETPDGTIVAIADDSTDHADSHTESGDDHTTAEA